MSTTWESDEAAFHLFRSSSGQPADTNTWMASAILSGYLGIPSTVRAFSSPSPLPNMVPNEALVSYWPLAGWHHNIIKYRGAGAYAARGIRTAGWDLVSLQRRLLRCEQSPIAVAE